MCKEGGSMGLRALVVVSILASAVTARGQRRGGEHHTQVLQIQLPVQVRFGDTTVAARTYRLTLVSGGFALTDPTTMLTVANIPVTGTEADKAVPTPRAELERHGDRVQIVMRAGDRVYRATGQANTVAPAAAPSYAVTLAKSEREVAGGMPEQQTPAQLVARAAKRYASGVKHCADKAHRGRWTTDDPRLVRCVCPIVRRWKMPALDAPLLMHWPLAKGRHGFSFSVTPEGKVTSCRVWAGAKPPPDPKMAATESETATSGTESEAIALPMEPEAAAPPTPAESPSP
jgi:hypothetical protein